MPEKPSRQPKQRPTVAEMMRRWSLATLLLPTCAQAHDSWSNGKPIADWIKKQCCDNEKPEAIDPSRVHAVIGTDPITHVYGIVGYRVDGFINIIPIERRYDSEDGLTWIFSGMAASNEYVPDRAMVYCLFTNEGS